MDNDRNDITVDFLIPSIQSLLELLAESSIPGYSISAKQNLVFLHGERNQVSS